MSATPSPSSLSGKLPSVLPALTSSSSHGGSHRFQPLTDQHQDDLEDHQVTIELGRVGIFDEDYAMEASSPSKEDKSTTAGKDENSPQASVASHDDRPALMSSINGVQPTVAQQVEGLLQAYWKKFQGVPDKKPPAMTPFIQMLVSSVLGFIGIFLVSVTDYWYLSKDYQFDGKGLTMLTGAYAATAVLVYEAYQSPLAQPRNVLGGYFFSSFTGVTVRIICGYIGLSYWVTGAIAVSFAIFLMNVTKTMHPPGGACALIAVIGGPTIHAIGYGYMLTSTGAAFIMVCVALLGNNLIPTRQYPLYWY